MALERTTSALALRINQRIFYGWVMLAVAALGVFASGPGQSYLFGAFVLPLSQDLGLSQTEIVFAYALASLVAAFGLPIVGRLLDRWGVRRVMIGITVAFSLSMMGFSGVDNLILLMIGFVALRFLGQGALVMSCHNLTAHWFDRQRGFALSIVALGFAFSVACYPPLAQWLINQVGWRSAWLYLGLFTGILLLPAMLVLVINKPEDLALRPDGSAVDLNDVDTSGSPPPAEVGLSLSEAMRTPTFWIIGVSIATLSMVLTALFFYQISIFESRGLSPQVAANVFPVTAVAMMITIPIIGKILDRYPAQWVFASGLLIAAGSVVLLTGVDDLVSALAYSVVFGITGAVFQTHLGYVWPHFFGRKHLGAIQGAGATINVFGASLGPLPLGIAYDAFGGYHGALLLLASAPVICAILVFTVKPSTFTAAR